MSDAETLIVNKRELARLLDCSLPTLADLMDRYPDFPVREKGSNGREYRFDAGEVAEFLRHKREEEARAAKERSDFLQQFTLLPHLAPSQQAAGVTSPTQALALARARLAERKLAMESGLLVSTAELRQVLMGALGRLGKFLEQLPGQVAREFNLPEAVVRAMRNRVDEQRRVFVRELRDLLAEMEEPESEHPPASRDGTTG